MAQNNIQLGVLPSLHLSKEINKTLKYKAVIESRFSTYNDKLQPSNEFDYLLTDFSQFITQKIDIHHSLGGGYTLRLTDDQFSHRFIQDWLIQDHIFHQRVTHRIRADQFFQSGSSPVFRLRYRWMMELPVKGETINPKELYFKIGNEYITVLIEDAFTYEMRLLPFMGYIFNPKNRVETGIDYRLTSQPNHNFRHQFWIACAWYYSFD